MTSLTSTAKGLEKSVAGPPGAIGSGGVGGSCATRSARAVVWAGVGGVSKLTVDSGASGGRPETICTGAGAVAGGRRMSGTWLADSGTGGGCSWGCGSRGLGAGAGVRASAPAERAGRGADRSKSSGGVGAAGCEAVVQGAGGGKALARLLASVAMRRGGAGGAGSAAGAEKPPSPTICCSISSILALTPSGRAVAASERPSESSRRDEEPMAASCSGDRPSRRTLRSMSNSRLRTKSLRRLRSIMALSSLFSSSSSLVSSWRELRSAQSVAGFATNRTTLRKKLSFLSCSAMAGRYYPGVGPGRL